VRVPVKFCGEPSGALERKVISEGDGAVLGVGPGDLGASADRIIAGSGLDVGRRRIVGVRREC
jgi:hypothetical protein